MRSHRTNEPSQRQLRVGEQIRHIVADTLYRGHFHDEALLNVAGLTVTEVRVSPDLKNATAYMIALGGQSMDKILPALNEAAHVFQKDINRQASLKFTPRIRFKNDDTFDEARRIDELLREIKTPPASPQE